jgi:hypothetical protein
MNAWYISLVAQDSLEFDLFVQHAAWCHGSWPPAWGVVSISADIACNHKSMQAYGVIFIPTGAKWISFCRIFTAAPYYTEHA